MRYPAVKRVLDVALSLVLLLTLSPLLVLLAVAVYLDDPGPVFYVHDRVGRHGRLFPFFKLRTMRVGSDRDGYEIAAHDTRITRIGGFLRRWHLDELPQLLNVVRGEMSLVGPRPTLAYQVAQYTPEQRRRLEVRPGITGLAQVKGLNALTWQERIRWDVYYVDHVSPQLDARILLQTFGAIAGEDNTYGHGWESSRAAAGEPAHGETTDG